MMSKPSWFGKTIDEVTAAEWRERADLAESESQAEDFERLAKLCDEEEAEEGTR